MARTNADIVVMSDANTMFAPDAIRRLVRHFEEPSVGCVSGELLLEQNGGVSGEGLYWKYENWIKRNESRLGFLIGCNGGIYALRPELYDPLPSSTIVDDFVISMRVLEKGYQVVLDPTARAVEPPCPSAKAEMIRKMAAYLDHGGELWIIVPDDSDPVNPDHLWFFTEATLRSTIEAAGLEVVRMAKRKYIERENFIYCRARKPA